MKYSYRSSFLFVLSVILGLAAWMPVHAQNITVAPPQRVDQSGQPSGFQFLFKADEAIFLIWDVPLPSGQLKIGATSGSYTQASLPVSGNQALFRPNDLGLGTGSYYAILTNASGNTLSSIQQEAASNASIAFSSEIRLAVESTVAPSIIGPRGTITDPTPVFEWSAVPGVTAYFIVVSSTPFELDTDPVTDEIVVRGATAIWQTITTASSVRYGETVPNTQLPTLTAPPLSPGNEYNYTILNVYDERDPNFTSDVFGTVTAFVFEGQQTVSPPNLTAPAEGASFFAEQTITFSWDPVDNANDYTFFLFERRNDGSSEIDFPVSSQTTTATLVDYAARANLRTGTYVWYVVANDESGSGASSASQLFSYEAPMGDFTVSARSTDGQSLTGVDVRVRSLDGGFTPLIPFNTLQASTVSDSLVAGLYEFTATKEDFADTTVTVTIVANQQNNVTVSLRSLPASIAGTIQDETGQPVAEALVAVTNTTSGAVIEGRSSSNGSFSISLSPGTYGVKASKAGFRTSASVVVNALAGQQQVLSSPIVLQNDQAQVSGRVTNSVGEAILRATVTATQGDVSFQTQTTGSGDYSFVLTSGTWTLSASREGFVPPTPLSVSLSGGDNLQNQNFTLIGRANQVSGRVFEIVTRADGNRDQATFEGATITATPLSGAAVSATTNQTGEFTLNLGRGTYTVRASAAAFTQASDEVTLDLTVAETLTGINFDLVPNTGSVAGVVTLPGGIAVEDATIEVVGVADTRSTLSGAYNLSLPPGTHTVVVSKDGLVAPDPRTVTVNPGANVTGINFTMLPNAGSIAGTVRSEGQGVAEVSVVATRGSEVVTTTTDGLGQFSLSVPSGEWAITASKASFVTSDPLSLVVGPGQTSSGNDIDLVANTTRIAGFVSDGSNALRNASVTLSEISNPSNSVTTFTKTDGTFAVQVTAGVSYSVSVTREGFRNVVTETGTLQPGAVRSLTIIMRASTASLSGTVRDANQAPLVDVKVVAIQNGLRADSTTTSLSGGYTLGVSPGATQLEVSLLGYTTGRRSFSVVAGQNSQGIDFQLAENFSTLSGTISSATDGSGIEGVLITASASSAGGTAITSANGSFILTRLIGDTYQIQVERVGFADTTLTAFEIPAGQNVVLNLSLAEAQGEVQGQALTADGTPIANATITLTAADGTTQQTVSGADGSYVFTGLPLGSYTVTASIAGFQTSLVAQVELTAEATSSTVDINDLIENTAGVSGRVTDAQSGGGLLGVRVTASGPAGTASTQTDTEGAFTLANLAPGAYTLTTTLSGFEGTAASVDLVNGATATQDLTMTAFDGVIEGRVTDQGGSALPFAVTVQAAWRDLVLSTQADDTGAYTIEGLAKGRTYVVSTNIFEEGIENASVSIDYPADAPTVTVNLSVEANTAEVAGNVGTGAATIQVINTADDAVVASGTSQSDGAYRIQFLPAGTYRIQPGKQGFVFSPASTSVTLSVGGSASANFTATSNIGVIAVNVRNSSGAALSGARVTAVSTDGDVAQSATTSSTGVARFEGLTGGKVYLVQATLEGFESTSGVQEISLGAGQEQNVNITLAQSTSSISGRVGSTSGGNVADANIQAENQGSGAVTTTTSNSSGQYALGSLAPGTYEVIASKAGFVADTLVVTLAAGQEAQNQDFSLQSTVVVLRGQVTFAGSGVAGVTVTATSATQLTTQTNSSGQFTFTDVPVSPVASDTVTYQVGISAADIASQTQLIRIAGSQAGQTITVPTFVLPSGQITLAFTDGVDPLDGVTVTFTPPNGTSQTIITDESGAFTSSNRLGEGTYRVAASKAGFLTPSAEDLRLILENNEQQLSRTIPLPYLHTPPETISASRDAILSVRFRQGFSAGNTTARIFFRRASENAFNEASMARQDTSFTGGIPAQRSLETITYFVQVDDGASGITYTSEQFSFEPVAEGILTTATVSPGVNGVRLRQGDTYRLTLAVRDGINDGLADQFVGGSAQGTVEWTSSDPAGLSVAFPEANNPTVVDVTAEQSGSYSLRVVTSLSGVRLTSEAALEVVNTPIGSVSLSVPNTRLSNTATGIQVSYGVADTSGASVLIGNSNVSWTLSTEGVATIDEQGFLVPTDARFIGPIGVTLTDLASGLSASTEVSLFANVDGTQAYTLVDNQGMAITLPQGSIPFPAEVGLLNGTGQGGKKRVFPAGTSDTYTVSDRIYRFTFRSDQALPGDSLVLDAELTLPVDPSLNLHEGRKAIAVFEPTTIQWTLVSGGSSAAAKSALQAGGSVTASAVRKVGEYAVLTQNEPLGIQHLSVLPSPFSPDTGPVKIGYFLNTSDPPANVTIRIFNIRGELVRILLDNDPQTPGRYGSRTGNREIAWDGLTDAGTLARNGRYIIQIIAEDSTGKETEIIPVVLIK